MDSRQRMIETTLRLLRSQGLTATGMNQIVQESKAPRGSIYYHFPGGKEQLAIEAVRTAGEAVSTKIRAALNAHANVAVALRRYIEAYAEEIRKSDYERGCPVANVAMDASATHPAIREVCEEIFNTWEALLAQRLRAEGFAKKEAAALAEFILSSIEGALIFCRARRSTEPLDRVAERVGAMLATRRKSARRA